MRPNVCAFGVFFQAPSGSEAKENKIRLKSLLSKNALRFALKAGELLLLYLLCPVMTSSVLMIPVVGEGIWVMLMLSLCCLCYQKLYSSWLFIRPCDRRKHDTSLCDCQAITLNRKYWGMSSIPFYFLLVLLSSDILNCQFIRYP